eukprot:symbB.v1.2.020823.t2/scaffold1772.1/size102061/2
MKWRREQALQQMEQLAKTDYGDVEHSEEVIQAQAEMRRAAEAAEKLRSELNQKKNNVSTMMMIRSKLKKKVENVQDQSQLQPKPADTEVSDRPKLVIFDLDQTLWSFDAAQPRFGPPHRVAPEGAVQCQAAVAKPFKEAGEIVRHIKGSGEYRMAVASANSQEKVCSALLQHMDFFQNGAGSGGIEKPLLAIFPGSKTTHFKQIAEVSGLDFREMLFFDDRALNIRAEDVADTADHKAAQKLGIVAHQVSSLDGEVYRPLSETSSTPPPAEPPKEVVDLIDADASDAEMPPPPPLEGACPAEAMLQEKLDASILARLMAEERLEELKLELAEAELKREEEAEEKARLLVQMVNVPTPGKGETPKVASEDGAMAALMKLQNRKNRKEEAPEPPPASEPEAAPAPVSNITRSPELDSYQEALRVLHQASQQEVAELQKQIAVLDQDSNKVPKLKTDQRALTNRQNLLQERMADLETEAVELEQTAKAGDELLDLRDSVVHELRQEVEQREERLRLLEDLVLKLDKERQHLKEEAERDASDAKDLFEEVMKLTNGEVKGPAMTDTVDTKEVHRRLAVASVHHRLAQLDLATAKAKGSAFADCVPRTWQGEETPASESLTLALAQGGLAKAAERILFRLEGIGRQADECGRGQTKLRMEMCEVACVAFRCAAAMASVLDAGLGEETSIEVSKALEAKLKRVEQTLKELMHKKWPLDSPSQALNGLQEVDSLIVELSKSTSSSKTSTRGFCYQFQRFQVAFAYGIESKTAADAKANAKAAAAGATAREPAEPVKVAEEDGAMAALMRLQNRNKKPEAEEQQPEPTEPEENSEAVEVVQEREREQFHEEQWPEIELRLRLAQRSSGTGSQAAWETEMQRLGKAIEVGLSRCATGGEEDSLPGVATKVKVHLTGQIL